MSQEPQQVDLGELTRLYDNRVHNLLKFNAGMEDAFPALRDELNDTRRWKSNLYQDRCESAYIEVSLFDAAKQALSEVAPDHPFLKGEPPSFGVWEKLSKENDEMRDELVRLREERNNWRVSSVCRDMKRQLDKAKGLLERLHSALRRYEADVDGEAPSEHRSMMDSARTFLASLAGREKLEQPTQRAHRKLTFGDGKIEVSKGTTYEGYDALCLIEHPESHEIGSIVTTEDRTVQAGEIDVLLEFKNIDSAQVLQSHLNELIDRMKAGSEQPTQGEVES